MASPSALLQEKPRMTHWLPAPSLLLRVVASASITLGENVTTVAQARGPRDSYINMVRQLAAHARPMRISSDLRNSQRSCSKRYSDRELSKQCHSGEETSH